MKTYKLLIINILLLTATATAFAQNHLFLKAYKKYLQHNYKQSFKLCIKGTKKYPQYPKFYLLCAQTLYQQNLKLNAVPWLKKYFALSSDPAALSQIGIIFFENRQYDSAITYLSRYISLKPQNSQMKHLLAVAEFRDTAYLHPVPFNPHPLPKNINSKYNEYFPEITANNTLFFTRLINNENIYFSHKKSHFWTNSKPLPPIINSAQQEGACTLSHDGKIMIFTRCNNYSGCDLFITFKKDTSWTKPVRLPYPINTKYWESQPCLANNGHTLLFASNRPGGFGKTDIWAVDFYNGKWQNLRNLGKPINTKGDEMSPFLHFDNHTLYFASNYHPGFGGYDIFYSKLLPNGKWSKPVNLGFPINSKGDQTRLIVNVRGDTAYFASPNKNNNLDIFWFKLYKKARPNPTLYIKAKIIDAYTLKPLPAHVSLINLESDSLIYSNYTDNFVITAKLGNYGLFAEHPGYLYQSKHFSLADTANHKNSVNIVIKLQPVAIGKTFKLHNIFFKFNDYKLKPQSFTELNKLVRFLKENSKLVIQISGYTDSIGSEKYNLWLSKMRAQSIANYLISKGINPNRLIVKGFGEKNPVAPNNTPLGRKLNRRVEIKIIKM